MPITARNEKIMTWEAVAADPLSHPLEAIKATHERLAAHGPTLRCRLMANKVIRKLLKFNDWAIAKQLGVRPVAIREAAKGLKATLEAAVQLSAEQKKEPETSPTAPLVEAPPLNLLEENVITSFRDGSQWMLKDGRPVEVTSGN